jgi:hypothetical protein
MSTTAEGRAVRDADASEAAALQRRCAYWQRILRLQDWDIEVVIARPDDIVGVGLNEVASSLRQCTIRILGEDDARRRCVTLPNAAVMADTEITLVHELVHLHLHDFDGAPEEGSPAHRALERAVDALARALVALDRESTCRDAGPA